MAARVGTHCIAEFYDCPPELLNNAKHISQAIREAARRAKSQLLHEVTHKFEPIGVTALALLAESHISIHTWPETGYAAVDAFTCGDTAVPEAACRYLAEALQAGEVAMARTQRGLKAHKLEPFGLNARVEPAPVQSVAPEDTTSKGDDESCPELNYAQISG